MKKTIKQRIAKEGLLAAIVLGGLSIGGCPEFASVNVANISNKNWYNGRTEQLCEKDLQTQPLTFDYGPITVEGLFDIHLGFSAEIVPDPEGKDSPIAVNYSWNKIGEKQWAARVIINDVPDEQMNWQWHNGGTWTLGFRVYDETFGPENGLFRQSQGVSKIDESSPYTDTIHYQFLKGSCTETLTNDINNLEQTAEEQEQQIQDLNQRTDNLEQNDFGYVIGDGRCDAELGEPADSPDCQQQPPAPPQPPSELERLVKWACTNLARGIDFNGLDTRIFEVTPTEQGFSYTENFELPIGHPEYGVTSHILRAGSTNYWVTVSGQNAGAITRMYAGIAEAEQLNPAGCNHILILNSNREPLANQSFGLIVDREHEPDIYEQVRVKPE